MGCGDRNRPKLTIPSKPQVGRSTGGDYELMPAMRRVISYSGLSFTDVMKMPYDMYLLMLKNSLIDEYRATPEGRQYLEDCERLNATEPDVEAARRSGFMR